MCLNDNCCYSFDKIKYNCTTVTIEEMENLASFIQEENCKRENGREPNYVTEIAFIHFN